MSPITDEQRAERKHHIGSSDMAAIMGLDTYRSAYDVWLDKTGQIIDVEAASPAMNAGNRFENGVLDEAESLLGPLLRNQPATVPDSPIAVNTDAIVVETGEPVEAKTAGLFGPLADWWGDDGSDQVPDRVIIQAHCHMLAWGRAVCHVPVFLGGRGFAMFQVPRNDAIAAEILERAATFWRDNVGGNVPPSGSKPHLQVVKLLRRTPEKVVAVDPEIVQEWLDARERYSKADKARDEAQAAVLAALGDAEAGLCGELGAVTYLETQRKAYSVEATSYRTLRHKKKGL